MYEGVDDIAIIELVLQGQQQAYATLVTRYQQYVFTLVMRYVKQRELAEELSQDVFLKAYRFLADHRKESKFSTWLYTIVHTTCLSHMRKKKDATILLAEDQMRSLSGQYASNGMQVRWEQQTHKQIIDRAIDELPGMDAQIITLFYLAELSLDEIGVVMGLTPGNVKVRLFRGRQKLKTILELKYMNELT